MAMPVSLVKAAALMSSLMSGLLVAVDEGGGLVAEAEAGFAAVAFWATATAREQAKNKARAKIAFMGERNCRKGALSRWIEWVKCMESIQRLPEPFRCASG